MNPKCIRVDTVTLQKKKKTRTSSDNNVKRIAGFQGAHDLEVKSYRLRGSLTSPRCRSYYAAILRLRKDKQQSVCVEKRTMGAARLENGIRTMQIVVMASKIRGIGVVRTVNSDTDVK